MARWISLILIMTISLKSSILFHVQGNCKKGPSSLKGEQITCTNVTTSFFQNGSLELHRSHWLKCENCDLYVIDENTFNFQRNNISFLTLYKNNIRRLNKHAFSRFPLLKSLTLTDNFIETIDRKGFYGIKRLNTLDLSNNNLKTLVSNLFIELDNLDILNLSYNEITDVGTNVFTNLIYLKYLYLNHNRLKKLEANTFNNLTDLKILNLDNNCIKEIHPNAFANLRNLNYLYINNNSLNYLVQYNFKNVPSLIDLQIRNNNLEEIPTSGFNGLKNMKYLYLGENCLKTIHPYGFVGLNNVEILELIGNKFEYFSFDFFKDMERLEMLWLEDNSINNFSIGFKSEAHRSLRTLGLKGNNLTFLNYKLLYNKMPDLKEIFIANNPWKCEFIVNMYNFFRHKNVSLCSTNACSFNDTESFIEDICSYLYVNETDFSTEYGSESTASENLINFPLTFCMYLFLFVDFR